MALFALQVITAESIGLFLSCAVVDFGTAAAINALYLFTAMVCGAQSRMHVNVNLYPLLPLCVILLSDLQTVRHRLAEMKVLT